MYCCSLTTCSSFFIAHSFAPDKPSSYLRVSALQRHWQCVLPVQQGDNACSRLAIGTYP